MPLKIISISQKIINCKNLMTNFTSEKHKSALLVMSEGGRFDD